jgi:hypothetical protein
LSCGRQKLKTWSQPIGSFSDFLDGAFLINELADGRSVEQTIDDRYTTIRDFALKFLTAANDFHTYSSLAKRLDLKEY